MKKISIIITQSDLPKREMSRKLSYALGILIVIGVAVEIGLRVFLGLGTPPLLQADDDIGYLFQPDQDVSRFGNQIVINEYHQRSYSINEYSPRAPRILFVGDSVTWGGALTDQSQTYPEQFRSTYRRECGQDVAALNASAGSWGLQNQYSYVKQFGLLESSLLVLQVGSHDLTQAKSDSGVVGCHPSYPNENPPLAVVELVQRYLIPRLPFYESDCGTSASLPTGQRYRENMDALQDIIESADDQNASVIVLHTPELPETRGSASYEKWRSKFKTTIDSLNIQMIDLHNGWQDRADVDKLYRDYVHLNEQGNSTVADTLFQILVKKKGKIPCYK
mgnify:CR=1 FL=1